MIISSFRLPIVLTAALSASGSQVFGNVTSEEEQQQQQQQQQQCPVLGCCDFDCCGSGTTWNTDVGYCIPKLDTEGFDGTYAPSFESGCVPRVCCEADCCGFGSFYDKSIQSCVWDEISKVPTASAMPPPVLTPDVIPPPERSCTSSKSVSITLFQNQSGHRVSGRVILGGTTKWISHRFRRRDEGSTNFSGQQRIIESTNALSITFRGAKIRGRGMNKRRIALPNASARIKEDDWCVEISSQTQIAYGIKVYMNPETGASNTCFVNRFANGVTKCTKEFRDKQTKKPYFLFDLWVRPIESN